MSRMGKSSNFTNICCDLVFVLQKSLKASSSSFSEKRCRQCTKPKFGIPKIFKFVRMEEKHVVRIRGTSSIQGGACTHQREFFYACTHWYQIVCTHEGGVRMGRQNLVIFHLCGPPTAIGKAPCILLGEQGEGMFFDERHHNWLSLH